MPNLQQMAMMLINMRMRQDPSFGQDPNSQAMIQAIQSGDPRNGEAVADQILNKSGMTREQGIQQALHMLGLR